MTSEADDHATTVQDDGAERVLLPKLLVPLLLGFFGLVLVIYARNTYVYIDPTTGPGSGFFPTWLGILLVALSAFNVVAALRERPEQTRGDEDEDSAYVLRYRKLGLFIVISAATIWLIAAVGAVPALFFFTLTEMLLVERHSVVRSVLTSILVPAVIFLIFEVALGVPLPGQLAEILGL